MPTRNHPPSSGSHGPARSRTDTRGDTAAAPRWNRPRRNCGTGVPPVNVAPASRRCTEPWDALLAQWWRRAEAPQCEQALSRLAWVRRQPLHSRPDVVYWLNHLAAALAPIGLAAGTFAWLMREMEIANHLTCVARAIAAIDDYLRSLPTKRGNRRGTT